MRLHEEAATVDLKRVCTLVPFGAWHYPSAACQEPLNMSKNENLGLPANRGHVAKLLGVEYLKG